MGKANIDKDEYLVSAIVSTYNSERFIRGCLEDLEAQTIADRLEIIVVNSSSEQNEEVIVNEFRKKYANIKYIKTEERETVYAAWNRGIEAASGKYITNANTDDRHRSDAFEVMATTLDSQPDIGLVYADCLVTFRENETYDSNSAPICFAFPEFSLRQLMICNYFGPQPMWRRSIHDKIGYFRGDYVVAGDYEFGIRAAWHYGAIHIKKLLGLYFSTKSSVGIKNLSKSSVEAMSIVRRFRDQIPLEDFYPMLKEMPNDVTARTAALVDFGNLTLQSNRYQDLHKATELYKEALELDSMNPLIRNNLAVAMLLNGDKTQAIALFEELKGQLPYARHNLGVIRDGIQGKTRSDLRIYNLEHAVVDSLPSLISELSPVATDYNGKPVSSSASLNFAESPIARSDKTKEKLKEGEALFAEGKIEEAERCFLSIIERDPKNKEAYNNLGVIAFQKNDLETAYHHFRTALKIDPLYRDVLDNMSNIMRSDLSPFFHNADLTSTSKHLSDMNILIINTFENRFNRLYAAYFSKENRVRIIRPDSEKDLTQEIIEWADIIWSMWCNQPVGYLSNLKNPPFLLTHIRSYEILTPALINEVKWENVRGAIFVADHIREIANQTFRSELSSIPQTTIHDFVELDKFPIFKNGPGKNIAYLGYLNHKKGIGLLTQCIQRAVTRDPGITFHIAGDFQEERARFYMKHLLAEMGIADHVVFHGWVENITEFLSNMNSLISTSPWEACPNNVIEAMACGIKPIIHNWPGAKQLFPNNLIFNTVDDFLNILFSEDYQPEAYRLHAEKYFNAEHQLPKIESFILQLADIGKTV
jgi:glycosyltransferase involved in cell wall biosynthesis